MFRHSRRLAEHIGMSAAHSSPVYFPAKVNTFWSRRWSNFARRGAVGKAGTLVGYGAAGVGFYMTTCLIVRTAHQPTVDALFAPATHHTLDEWADIEPTLQPGDLLLMRGHGLMSWTITTAQFLYSFMNPAALRYSHVAVVVAPAIMDYRSEEGLVKASYQVRHLEDVFTDVPDAAIATTSSATTAAVGTSAPATPPQKSVHDELQAEEVALHRRPSLKRGAVILEAMDNKGYDVADVTGCIVHDAVQVVEAGRRIYSTAPDGAPAYAYFAVRRLQHYEHTPERAECVKDFCVRSVGRRMDESLLYPLAFLWPALHTAIYPLRQNVTGEVSCSELIAELYQALGIVKRCWRWVPLGTGTNTASSCAASGDASSTENPAPVIPVLAPTDADKSHNRAAGSLHVFDYRYGRVQDRADRPVTALDRPLLPATSTIENGEMLASAALRLRSTQAVLQPCWPEVESRTLLRDMYGRDLIGERAEQARERLRTRTTATYVLAENVPEVTLRAGDVTRGVDGQYFQLQWYYRHNSLATAPYHFTVGSGESVLDFDANIGLEREHFMAIHHHGEDAAWALGEA